jgi:hypothetical protein
MANSLSMHLPQLLSKTEFSRSQMVSGDQGFNDCNQPEAVIRGDVIERPHLAHCGHCQLRGGRLQWAVSIHQSLGFAAITLLASNQNAMSEHLGSS